MTDAPPLPLFGTWDFEASSDGRFLGRGSATFKPIEGGAFVIERATDEPDPRTAAVWAEHSPMPVTSILGFDDSNGELAMLYSDAQGVFRIYRMRLTDEAWTVWRDAPGFNQRFVGRFENGGAVIAGAWETSEDGSIWTDDFDLVYRRRDRPQATDEIHRPPESDQARNTTPPAGEPS